MALSEAIPITDVRMGFASSTHPTKSALSAFAVIRRFTEFMPGVAVELGVPGKRCSMVEPEARLGSRSNGG